MFAVRTFITALRAAYPRIEVVLDGDAFAAAGVLLDPLHAYVDGIVFGESGDLSARSRDLPNGVARWWRAPMTPDFTVERLVELSLTPGVDRVLVQFNRVDPRVLIEVALRAAVQVDVTAVRRLTAAEVIARHQAQRRRQDETVHSTIARGTTAVIFELPGFVAPVSITADTTIFAKPGQTDIEHRNLRVNGSSIAGGSAEAAPALPLVEPERVGTAPLTIALTDAYRYDLAGEETLDGRQVYVIAFEPITQAGPVARGRAWIDAADFSLWRLQIVQAGLRGPIVSSEQVEDFGPFAVDGFEVRLPVRTRMFQMYDGAGHRTPVHRTLDFPRYDVNLPDFDDRLREAHASPFVMLRETPEGLRYLLKDETGARRVAAGAGQRIRAAVVGMLIDPNISEPLPFAGVSYVDMDLFGTGAQVSVFFAGLYGEMSWSVPAIGRTRWQLDGRGFGIAVHYNDRLFRDGSERYAENIRQRPANLSVNAVRPVGARVRVRAGYTLDVTGFERGESTASAFRVPATAVVHGFVGAMEGERGPWSARAWWNPARRQGWRSWGMPGVPGASEPDRRAFQRYGFAVSRTLALRASLASRLETAWMAGAGLDRFSRYSVNSFDNRLHGYPTATIRYDRGVMARSVTSLGRHGLRLDGFADVGVVRDAGFTQVTRVYPGIGTAVELPGPFRSLVSVEWGYGFNARRASGGTGTQALRITGYRMF